MTLLERVLKLLNERGITVKQAERESGLSNATIRKWETQNPSLDSLTKLAKYLHVTLDYLAQGKEETLPTRFEITCDGRPLTEVEADLIAMFRLLDDRDRRDVFDSVLLKYERMTGEKASVYLTYSDTNEEQKNNRTLRDDSSASGIA